MQHLVLVSMVVSAGVRTTFYTHGLCPYAQRVALALEEKGVAHERVEIDLSNKPSWYVETTGTSLVPAIKLPDGRVQAESIDICQMLDSEFPDAPTLNPPERDAEIQSLVSYAREVESAGWALLGGAWNFPTSGQASPRGKSAMDRALRRLETSIESSGGPFLCGDRPTVADCVIAPFVARFCLVAPHTRNYNPLDSSLAVKRWMEALKARESWKATFPNEEAFLRSILKHGGSLDYFDYTPATLANP